MSESERFLHRLTKEAEKRLPSSEVAALVGEAKDHLEQSIEARLELGMGRDAAEAEALVAFGTAQALGRETRRQGSRIDRRFLAVALALVALWGALGGGRSFPDWSLLPMLAILLAAHGAFLYASAKARRLQWRTFVLVLLPILVFASVPDARTYVTVKAPWDGKTRLRRDELAQDAAEARTEIDRTVAGYDELRRAYARFTSGEIGDGPSRVPSYRDDGTVRLFHRARRSDAAQRWREALRNGELARRSALAKSRWPEDLRNAVGRPWPLEMPYAMLEVASRGFYGALAFYGTLHLAAWAAGQAVRSRPRRKRGVA